MKELTVVLLLFTSILSFGQEIEAEKLWRTKGVYDSIGNFVERAKIQSFLYSNKSDQLFRLRNQDKVNMETGESKVFVYRDTLNLEIIKEKSFKVSDNEVLTVHTKDSITIEYNGYTLPYVKIDLEIKQVSLDKLKTNLINKPYVELINGEKEYQFTYQDTDLVKVKPLDRDSDWESDYKIIDFHGFLILQGITSAPKLITKVEKGKVKFIKIDYRFDNQEGELLEN